MSACVKATDASEAAAHRLMPILTLATDSALQRIKIGAGELVQFADVVGVKTKPRTKHLFLQVQMKIWRQTRKHFEARVIMKFSNNPLAVFQDLIGQS